MADDLTQPASEVGPYLDIVRAYDKAASKWHTQGKKIIKRYIDERSDQQAQRLKYNILWANVETLKPAIYAKTPKPEVERRFLDKDPVGRVASEVLERCLDYFLSTTAFGSTMRQARTDYLLVGRGVAWVRYEPKFKPIEGPVTDEASQITDDVPLEELAWEEVLSDYVHWRDFGHNVARTWEEVEQVWRIVYMTRDQMKKRGFAEWNTIPLDYTDKSLKDAETDIGKKAAVYELWDKSKRCVYWFTKTHPRFLDKREDPLGLDKFFPCSQPIYATLANESLIPVPDFVEYQDQAQEIDELTSRIGSLQRTIKAAGVYDGSQRSVGRLLSEGVQNTLIAVDAWAALAEKGGLKGTMELLPMKEIAETLLMLYEARERVKQDLYEITGMSDIIRGATKATETATAQNIKNNYITLRLSEKQREMQRLARNTIEIMGNIICRHFSPDMIMQIAGVKLLTAEQKQQIAAYPQMAQQAQSMGVPPPPPPPEDVQELMNEPTWEEVMQLLRSEPDRSFRIDIETDSTIEMDAGQDRDEAMAFLEAVGGFIQQSKDLPPSLAPLAGAMLEFGVRKWRVGRQLEGVINSTVEKLEEAAKNPPPQQPDPQMAKVQQDGQLQQAQMQQDSQLEQAKLAANVEIEKGKQALEMARLKSSDQQAASQAALEDIREKQRLQMEDARERDRLQMEQWIAELDAKTRIEVAEITAKATLDAAQIKAAQMASEGSAKDEAEERSAAV